MKKKIVAFALVITLVISSSVMAWAEPVEKIVSDDLVVEGNTEGGGEIKENLEAHEEKARVIEEKEESEDGNDSVIIYDNILEDTSVENGGRGNMFSGGTGTTEDPFQITTSEQFNDMRQNLSASYMLMRDIDLSEFSNWDPIGSSSNPFIGNFDGNNHTITGLKITEVKVESNPACIGLFGRIGDDYNTIIKNLKVENAFIDINYSSSIHVGIIAGYSSAKNIINCVVQGNINATGCYNICAGGIVGRIPGNGYSIQSCKSNVVLSLESSAMTGGTYGYVECGGISGGNGNIIDCVNYGAIDAVSKGTLRCGGICGDGFGTISHCINYGNVDGKATDTDGTITLSGKCVIGGIVGIGSDGDSIHDCINYGNISGSSTYSSCYVAGIVGNYTQNNYGPGYQENHCVVNNCFSLGNINSSEIAYRIYRDADRIKDCYSLKSVFINGATVSENLGVDQPNGANLSEEEIEKKIEELFRDKTEEVKGKITIPNDVWYFGNPQYVIERKYIEQLYPKGKAKTIAKAVGDSVHGMCFSMAITDLMLNDGTVQMSSFEVPGEFMPEKVIDLSEMDKSASLLLRRLTPYDYIDTDGVGADGILTVTAWMKYVMLYQFSEEFNRERTESNHIS